jgi:hypothetical protein
VDVDDGSTGQRLISRGVFWGHLAAPDIPGSGVGPLFEAPPDGQMVRKWHGCAFTAEKSAYVCLRIFLRAGDSSGEQRHQSPKGLIESCMAYGADY